MTDSGQPRIQPWKSSGTTLTILQFFWVSFSSAKVVLCKRVENSNQRERSRTAVLIDHSPTTRTRLPPGGGFFQLCTEIWLERMDCTGSFHDPQLVYKCSLRDWCLRPIASWNSQIQLHSRHVSQSNEQYQPTWVWFYSASKSISWNSNKHSVSIGKNNTHPSTHFIATLSWTLFFWTEFDFLKNRIDIKIGKMATNAVLLETVSIFWRLQKLLLFWAGITLHHPWLDKKWNSAISQYKQGLPFPAEPGQCYI